MKTELWQRAEILFQQVLEINEDQREAYLKAASQGDSELSGLVQDLLRSYSAPDNFMEQPVFSQGLRALGIEDRQAPIEKLGRYEIIKHIGTGGMGEVFLAHDSVLNRSVALKLLPAFLTNDPQRVRRFQQEAHAASTISHPNIAHIYEIGMEGDRHFTSMEYVEGRTLREVLNQGRLTIMESLKIALEIGRALESAHASGVIHRDIKPENIMIRPDGYVKVLDFGLAKLCRMSNTEDPHKTQTATLVLTEPGLIMGSPAYMSPEQARGFDVDARTDIWSLGVVLYEMLCGWTPFQGATRMDLLAALLREEPAPISEHLRHAHPRLRKLLTRMLSKDRDQRYQTSSEVVTDLQNLIRDVRWRVKHKRESTLFQGSRLAFLRSKALEAFHAPQATVIRKPFPLFIVTIIAGIALTWSIQSSRHREVLVRDPEVEQYYQRAVEAIYRDDFYAAAYHLDLAAEKDFLANNTSSLLVRARLAEVWAELDYSDTANYQLSVLAELVRTHERFYPVSEVDFLYVDAVKATVNRDFRTAVGVYKQIVEKDPANAIAWVDLGRSYERLRWWDHAANSYRQACLRNSSLASAFLRLATVEMAQGNEREANTAFDRALQLYRMAKDDDGALELLTRRTISSYRLGRRDEARGFQDEAARIPRSNLYQQVKHNFSLAGVFHKESQLAKGFEMEARKHADSISRVGLLFNGPDQLLVNGLIDIANSYLREDDLINAQQYVLEALNIAERSDLKIAKAKALYVSAQLYLHQGFPAHADREFKQALRLEFPHADVSDKQIAVWRNSILDLDYEVAIDRFKAPSREALMVLSN